MSRTANSEKNVFWRAFFEKTLKSQVCEIWAVLILFNADVSRKSGFWRSSSSAEVTTVGCSKNALASCSLFIKCMNTFSIHRYIPLGLLIPVLKFLTGVKTRVEDTSAKVSHKFYRRKYVNKRHHIPSLKELNKYHLSIQWFSKVK